MDNIIDLRNQGKSDDRDKRFEEMRALNEELVKAEKAEIQDKWDKAKELFPKRPFPWQVLPSPLAESFRQLARSHATSPTSIPNAAMAILSSVLGATIEISAKGSWRDRLILWFADIRYSGEGKTPVARALCRPLYQEQEQVNDEYERRLREWKLSKNKDKGEPPKDPRGFFMTDLTIEGIRDDISGHGGTVCILDELSSFISSQNQYKGKGGSDREAWLSLYDGAMARSVRAGKKITIKNARVNIFGGIQPDIWIRFFGGDKKLYLSDGTLFRFLPVYEGEQFHELTPESWSDENRDIWENTVKNAMRWADEWIMADNWKPVNLCLNESAQELFFEWGNDLKEIKFDLPNEIKGFVPKITGAALRLTGILHCMDCFLKNEQPSRILKEDDVQKGIETAQFFMGHIVNAIESLATGKKAEFEEDERVINLRETLNKLRDKTTNNMITVGEITEKYNESDKLTCKENPRAIGALLRTCGLTLTAERRTVNGYRGYCLIWNQKTDFFLK